MVPFRLFLFISLTIVLAACGGPAVPTPTSRPPTEVVVVPSDTAIPPTSTATPLIQPATPTPQPTNTTLPSATPETPTPTATVTAPPVAETATPTANPTGNPTGTTTATADATAAATSPPPPSGGEVTQPPYAASACSDKYPCNDDIAAWEARIRVPAGFEATYFARLSGSPTSMSFGPDGRLYVAVQEGTIYTVDSGGQIGAYVSGFNNPTGIAFQPGTSRLFVSDRRLNENINGESRISVVEGGGASQLIGGLPCCYTYFHAANGIAFGPDGFGYVGVGGRADHGEILEGPNAGEQDELHPLEASILRFNPATGGLEPYARGFRNPYDIAWDANGQLYATDNAPDYGPPEELHRVVPGGQHGYPYFDCDTCFSPPADITVIPPIYQFIPHSAPTGITAYLGDQFPGYYNSLFVTLWSAFPGAQKVVRFGPGGAGASNFATGFAAPIDVTVGPDGSLYVADWATGIIFRISYTG